MHKRTKALDISPAVKKAVYARDGGLCVICGAPGAPNAHYISRGQSGLGIEQNVVTLCSGCHRAYDQTAQRKSYRREIENYLRAKYENWGDMCLTYKKYGG